MISTKLFDSHKDVCTNPLGCCSYAIICMQQMRAAWKIIAKAGRFFARQAGSARSSQFFPRRLRPSSEAGTSIWSFSRPGGREGHLSTSGIQMPNKHVRWSEASQRPEYKWYNSEVYKSYTWPYAFLSAVSKGCHLGCVPSPVEVLMWNHTHALTHLSDAFLTPSEFWRTLQFDAKIWQVWGTPSAPGQPTWRMWQSCNWPSRRQKIHPSSRKSQRGVL